jgi:hypothetical protein
VVQRRELAVPVVQLEVAVPLVSLRLEAEGPRLRTAEKKGI